MNSRQSSPTFSFPTGVTSPVSTESYGSLSLSLVVMFTAFLLGARRSSRRRTAARAVSRHQRSDDQRVVVTGMGVVSPFGNEVDDMYEKLCRAENSVRKIDRFDVSKFKTQFGAQIVDETFDAREYVDKKSLNRYDKYLTYAMVSGKKALEMANLKIGGEEYSKLDKSRCGVLVGSGMGGIHTTHVNSVRLEDSPKNVSPFFIPYAITNMASGLLGIDTKFTGPNYSISTACASGNFSIRQAAEHIKNGDADLMLCGGVEAPIAPSGLAGFVACKALSARNEEPERASRPWDKDRDGFVIGEGAGVLVLEKLSHAKARGATILAEYLGGSFSCDGHHMTEPRKDGAIVSKAMVDAMENAGVSREQIGMINCHATSTPAGDMCEIRAIKKAFDNQTNHLAINGTKSMIGHSLGAAAGLEAVVCIKSLQTNTVHPTRNLDNPEEELTIFAPTKKVDKELEAVMSNSFGFGGHNGVIIMGKYE